MPTSALPMVAALILAGAAFAQAPIAVSVAAAPHLDPAAPPASTVAAARGERRASALAAPSATSASGALAAKVARQLQGSFDAADTARRGALTRAEARAGGFGFVAQHFDAIDTRHAGEVTFADVQRYLRQRGTRDVPR